MSNPVSNFDLGKARHQEIEATVSASWEQAQESVPSPTKLVVRTVIAHSASAVAIAIPS